MNNEIFEGELMEIEGLIGLAKADNTVKNILLDAIVDTFGDELEQRWYEYFSEQGILR